MFTADKIDLSKLLEDADDGRLQLPDFQRDYVWGDMDVRSLIASVAKGFPVGALLTLKTGGEVRFKPRLLAGVPSKDSRPDHLLLDGQQRITSLYQATFSKKAVRTRSPRGTGVDRFYYLDIEKAVSAGEDIEDAIIGVPVNRVMKTRFGRDIILDLSTQEKEFENRMFPLNCAFESTDWFHDWRDYSKGKKDILDLEKRFERSVVRRIARYEMPIIQLGQENGREAICLVFEKVNVGGKKLDAFELLTAIFAASDFDLRHDWNGPADRSHTGRRGRIVGSPPRDVLTQVASTEFLQACTLLHTRERRLARFAEGIEGRNLPQISCKREALLALPLDAFETHADAVEAGFIEAGAFLNENMIMWKKDIPYPPLIVGLASIFAILGKKARSTAAKKKIARWFWSVTLGEILGSSTETLLAKDVPEVVDWITGRGSGTPQTLETAFFQQERLASLRTRASAAYKGIHALVMRHGCRDFKTNRPIDIMTFFNDRIDIHHIFPQAWCKKQGIQSKTYNSIVNKTPLSKASNISVGGHAPSVYLRRIKKEQKLSSAELDDILRSHLIEPKYLRKDDFESFFSARTKALSKIVGKAMGKPVVAETGSDEVEHDIELEDDELAELETAV